MIERASSNLAFCGGKYDVTAPYGVTLPTFKDFKEQAPHAICEVTAVNVPRTMLINPHVAPFDNPELRRAMALSLDRMAFVDIVTDGVGHIGGRMLPPPEGVWGRPPEVLKTLPGYNPDVAKNRDQAKKIMEKLGYGPNNHLATKISTRNIPAWPDPAVLLSSQLKEIYIDTELHIVHTTQSYPKVMPNAHTLVHA